IDERAGRGRPDEAERRAPGPDRAGDAGESRPGWPPGNRHLVHDPERPDVSRPGQARPRAQDCLGIEFTTETRSRRLHREGVPTLVIPAKAGIHLSEARAAEGWVPASAETTNFSLGSLLCLCCELP